MRARRNSQQTSVSTERKGYDDGAADLARGGAKRSLVLTTCRWTTGMIIHCWVQLEIGWRHQICGFGVVVADWESAWGRQPGDRSPPTHNAIV